MPFFTLQISPQGPVVNAAVMASGARRAALQSANLAIPDPVFIRALIDTGATSTCVDPSVLTTLGLSPTGIVKVNTPSTGSQPHTAEQFDVALLIPGPQQTHHPLIIENMPVIGTELLQQQGFHALIGRDVLATCLFGYNGAMEEFWLAY